MSKSPLYKRTIVRSGIDTAAAALANEVLTVGDDYAAVGKIIGKLFEQGAKNKEGVDKAEEQENKLYDKAREAFGETTPPEIGDGALVLSQS